jgi:hypothetical protein
MAGQQPQTLRQDELPEYSFVGPFGGIQSEVQLDQYGNNGFVDVQNIMFRKAAARIMPTFTPLAVPSPGEIIIGMADFFNVNGVRRFVVWTPTKMYFYNAGVWTQVTGALTGSTSQFMQWDVVGYKLYFSQQKDTIWVWDGITAGFATASANPNNVPCKYLCEIGFHLVVANTIEGGVTAPNRVRWSGIGDGTDWASFSSGQNDLFNGLGPINGLARIYQNGYAFQQWGITQIVPTGIGLAPFQFISMGSRAKGSILPYGVASFGELVACYVGKNDIYLFDGTESQPIGSRPIDGNRRLGARVRIFNDLFTALETNIFGFILTSANGNDYESYWLFIPSLNKAWIYHFDEGNWTQMFFASGQLVGPAGVAPLSSAPRWIDLSGTWLAQSSTWAALANTNQLDTLAISDFTAQTVDFFNFNSPGSNPTSGSINPSDGWYIRSGQLDFGDPRHAHTVKKVRLRLIDNGAVTIRIRWTNEKGQQDSSTLTYGTGSGQVLVRVIPVALPGQFLTWELSGPPGVAFGITEFTPIYDVAGEIQMGVR